MKVQEAQERRSRGLTQMRSMFEGVFRDQYEIPDARRRAAPQYDLADLALLADQRSAEVLALPSAANGDRKTGVDLI